MHSQPRNNFTNLTILFIGGFELLKSFPINIFSFLWGLFLGWNGAVLIFATMFGGLFWRHEYGGSALKIFEYFLQ